MNFSIDKDILSHGFAQNLEHEAVRKLLTLGIKPACFWHIFDPVDPEYASDDELAEWLEAHRRMPLEPFEFHNGVPVMANFQPVRLGAGFFVHGSEGARQYANSVLPFEMKFDDEDSTALRDHMVARIVPSFYFPHGDSSPYFWSEHVSSAVYSIICGSIAQMDEEEREKMSEMYE